MTITVRPHPDEEAARAAIEQVTGRISNAGGEVLATIPWNPPRRRMAYPIKDFGDGFYVTTVFNLEAKELRPIENTLKLNEHILRFLVVRATDLNVKQAQQRLQQMQAAAATPPPQPAPAPQQAPTPTTATAEAPAPAAAAPVEEPSTPAETPPAPAEAPAT